MPERTFDWYRTVIDLGNFEVEHGRVRFYENSKLHLAIAAGSLALASYSLTSGVHIVLILALLTAILGALNAFAWLGQLKGSSRWHHRWRRVAAELENHSDFRSSVGAADVRVWSHDDISSNFQEPKVGLGATSRLYRGAVVVVGLLSHDTSRADRDLRDSEAL